MTYLGEIIKFVENLASLHVNSRHTEGSITFHILLMGSAWFAM